MAGIEMATQPTPLDPEALTWDQAMAVSEIQSFLLQTQVLRGFDAALLGEIARFSTPLKASFGKVLVSEDQPGDGIYFLVKGHLEVFKESGEGERRKIATLAPGSTAGEMAMIDGLPASATVQVGEPSWLIHLSEAGLNQLAETSPAAFIALIRRVARQTSLNLRQTTLALSRYLQRTADLTEALHQALESTRNKTQFFATMSHELRTPLNAILGYSELVEEEMMETNRLENPDDLRRIQVAGRHMLDLINNILDVSKIEAGKMTLHLETFSVKDLIAETTAMVHALAQVHGNRFEVHGIQDLEMTADQTKIRQSIINLLGNAFKYTRQGKVALSVRWDEEADRVIFQVSDTGVGMSSSQMATLFQSYTTANTKDAGRMGSSGLGLFASQCFCRMMGGRITVDSQPGKGSTFTIAIPRVVAPG